MAGDLVGVGAGRARIPALARAPPSEEQEAGDLIIMSLSPWRRYGNQVWHPSRTRPGQTWRPQGGGSAGGRRVEDGLSQGCRAYGDLLSM